VALTYDPVAHTYTVLANGVSVLTVSYTVGGTIGAAGFFALVGNGVDSPILKNFYVGYASVAPPYLTNSWNGSQLTLSWPAGFSLQTATNVLGAWTTSLATSPLVVTP
jgi:hypothetical protein